MAQLPNDSWHNGSAALFTGLDLLLELKPLFIPLYATLVVVACIGNLFLILLIALTKKLHCTTNFLIGNLAVADFIMCLACVPLTVSYAFEERGWLFGTFMCHFVTLLQAATVFVSVLSLTAIAIDRYVVVAYPIRRRISHRACIGLVACIWLLSIVASVPTSLHTHYLDLNAIGHDMIICEEFWKHEERERLLYSCLMLLLSYMLPLLAVSISFCAITYHLRRRNVPGTAHCCQDKWTRTKHKTFRVLTVSVVCFAVCWLPLQVVNFIRDIDEEFTILPAEALMARLVIFCGVTSRDRDPSNAVPVASVVFPQSSSLLGFLRLSWAWAAHPAGPFKNPYIHPGELIHKEDEVSSSVFPLEFAVIEHWERKSPPSGPPVEMFCSFPKLPAGKRENTILGG